MRAAACVRWGLVFAAMIPVGTAFAAPPGSASFSVDITTFDGTFTGLKGVVAMRPPAYWCEVEEGQTQFFTCGQIHFTQGELVRRLDTEDGTVIRDYVRTYGNGGVPDGQTITLNYLDPRSGQVVGGVTAEGIVPIAYSRVNVDTESGVVALERFSFSVTEASYFADHVSDAHGSDKTRDGTVTFSLGPSVSTNELTSVEGGEITFEGGEAIYGDVYIEGAFSAAPDSIVPDLFTWVDFWASGGSAQMNSSIKVFDRDGVKLSSTDFSGCVAVGFVPPPVKLDRTLGNWALQIHPGSTTFE